MLKNAALQGEAVGFGGTNRGLAALAVEAPASTELSPIACPHTPQKRAALARGAPHALQKPVKGRTSPRHQTSGVAGVRRDPNGFVTAP
jgi:hypothetical protein